MCTRLGVGFAKLSAFGALVCVLASKLPRKNAILLNFQYQNYGSVSLSIDNAKTIPILKLNAYIYL